ncbi:hypothetical protein [Mannheimia indoligenes]|uniref:hypothetical protein n=1 Tax=Mannheimia indoligenes TaxID=3103145 RepID=UPI002FE5E92D
MAKIHLINEYNMPIYDNSLSYWSMHFISVLECLVYHNNLQFRPIIIPETQTVSSLATMKSNYPNSFFDVMANYISNWGIQYFMVHYLNHEIGLELVDKIKEKLDDLFNIPNYKDYSDFEFYISGHDSELSKNIEGRFDEVYPKNFDFNLLEKRNLIKNSDICLVLKNYQNDQNIAIFGEIEGNHGDKLFTDSFWNGKSDFCVIGIGAVDGYQKGKFYLERYLHKRIFPKLNIIFEKNSYVVRDFLHTINEFRYIFNYGLEHKNYSDNSNYSYIVNEIIIENWNMSILYILDQLYQIKNTSNEELVGEVERGNIKLIVPMDN